MKYRVQMTDDGLPEILDEQGIAIGRALTKQDGDAIVDVLNGCFVVVLRDRLLDAINDAVENIFDEVPS
jgi:hypothetical protein